MVKIHLLSEKLFRNKVVTFIAFITLITAIIFIELHPKSVWYYFVAGFFVCRMLSLISKKVELQLYIANAQSKLKDMYD